MHPTNYIRKALLSSVVFSALLLAGCFGGTGGGASSAASPSTPSAPVDSSGTGLADTLPADYRATTIDVNAANTGDASYIAEREPGIVSSKANLAHWTRDSNGDYIRGAGVTVAVVDDGIDLTHFDLSANIITVAGHDPSHADGEYHGTHVAGIIGALLNGQGVVGVAPEAKILPINYLGSDIRLHDAYKIAENNGAFVINNSWGYAAQALRVAAGGLVDNGGSAVNGEYAWITVPNRDFHLLWGGEEIREGRLEIPEYRPITYTAEEDRLVVFAQGNDGWNSQTGRPDYCEDQYFSVTVVIGVNVGLCLDSSSNSRLDNLDLPASDTIVTVYGYANRYGGGVFSGEITVRADPMATLTLSKDLSGLLTEVPLEDDVSDIAAERWLNVVAVDSNNNLADFTSGCGVTRDFCLAAPGVGVASTVPDDGSNNGVDSDDGTSMAAPHVSGAAALLKGAFPNLTAEDVADILLESADGAGDCASEASKAVSCTDSAYGHGILNVQAAFTPNTFVGMSGGAGSNEVRSLADTRIELSPAFGSSSWQRETLDVAGLDAYGRAFFTRIDFSDGVWVTKPVVADNEIESVGIHSAFASPLARQSQVVSDIARNELNASHTSQRSDEGGYGVEQYGAYQSRHALVETDLGSLAWRYRSGAEDAHQIAGSVRHYWQAPFDSQAVHQAQYSMPVSRAGFAGAGADQKFGMLYGAGDGVSQAAARWSVQSPSGWSAQLEGGGVFESDTVLGGEFTGGFAVEETRTHYARVAGEYDLGAGFSLYGDYLTGKSHAAGESGGIVEEISARVDEWALGAAAGDWRLVYSKPLAIARGNMDLSYISGYDSAGDYAVTRESLDLAVERRVNRVSLLHTGKDKGAGLSYAFGADYLHNAPSRDYAGDVVVMSGALRYTF